MRKAARKSGTAPAARRDESLYSKASCEMRLVDPKQEGFRISETKPGDFYWQDCDATAERPAGYRTLHARFPDGSFAIIPVKPQHPDDNGPVWDWDGNVNRPTLYPSVHHIGHWHGWVRAGMMQSC